VSRDHALLVVGGGLAGLAAGIAAARRGVRVAVCEAASFGRDKVCGEFLSPEVGVDLADLLGPDWVSDLGAVPLRTALITSPRGARVAFDLPGPPAHALTRRALERNLAARARAAGAELFDHAPVRDLRPAPEGLRYSAGPREGLASAAVLAFGKRSPLDAPLALPRAARPGAFAALKAYFSATPGALEADIELHLIRGGYVGLCPVEGGRIGLCALLDSPGPGRWPGLIERLTGNSALDARLARLGDPLSPVRGLARFGFGPQRIAQAAGEQALPLLFTGDAARMMPPFTGDGIAVALRSGRLAATAAAGPDPVETYARAYRAEFAPRLRVAALLHRAFLAPHLLHALAPFAARSPRIAERLYAWTRG
jgi:flavin-dependent dehydrogenase